jgi:hypothetical protein
MPIEFALEGPIVRTILAGRVTDEELLAHYTLPVFLDLPPPWLELIDGRGITDMAVTAGGQGRLAAFAAGFIERLRGGRVAMVAASDVTYGMFRMWQIRREGLGYEVRVYRDIDEARAWLTPDAVPKAAP